MSKAMRAVGEDVWKTKVDKVVSMRGEEKNAKTLEAQDTIGDSDRSTDMTYVDSEVHEGVLDVLL